MSIALPADGYFSHVRRDIFPLVTGGRGTLLDVGGGVGATAAVLKEERGFARAGVVDGAVDAAGLPELDFSYRIDLAARGALQQVCDAQGPFDTILCLDILEHLVDPWAVVALLHGALKEGGELVVSLPNVRHYHVLWPLLVHGEWRLTDEGLLDRTHLRFFTHSGARELVTSSGLVLETSVGLPSYGRWAGMARRLAFGLLDPFTDYQYGLRARRVAPAAVKALA